MKPEEIAYAYEDRRLADGRIVSLKSYYYVMNNLFRETINLKGGDSNHMNVYAKNLLTRLAPRSEAFLVSRFTWIDLSLAFDDARNGLPYAPYIMFLIERVSRLIFKKDVKHQAYQLKQLLHSDHKKRDSSFMAAARGIPVAPTSSRPTRGGSLVAPPSSRSSSYHPRSDGSKLKNLLIKNMFSMCSYETTTAYEVRKDINDLHR